MDEPFKEVTPVNLEIIVSKLLLLYRYTHIDFCYIAFDWPAFDNSI